MPKSRSRSEKETLETIRQLSLAECGDAASQNVIAAKLAVGDRVKKDFPGALYWYAQAVKQGYTHSKWNAGTMLLAGEGVAIAYVDLGLRLIEEAANAGNPSACRFLSDCYAEGRFGKLKDPSLSKQWSDRGKDHERFVEYGQPVDIGSYGVRLLKPVVEWIDVAIAELRSA